MEMLIWFVLYVVASVFTIAVIYGTKHDIGIEKHSPYFIVMTERRSLFAESVFTIHVYAQDGGVRVRSIKGNTYEAAYEKFLKFKNQE